MLVFRFKDNNADDNIKSALLALNLAIELNSIFENIRNEWIKLWKDQFGLDIERIDLKCGINTGETLVRKIHTEKRDQFTVFGSIVNLASRLEELAEKNQILVSEETKNKIINKFILRLITFDPKTQDKGV